MGLFYIPVHVAFNGKTLGAIEKSDIRIDGSILSEMVENESNVPRG